VNETFLQAANPAQMSISLGRIEEAELNAQVECRIQEAAAMAMA
jgi:hypothetical protein